MDIVDAANAMLEAIRVRLLAKAHSLAEVVTNRLEMTWIIDTTTTTHSLSDHQSAIVVRDDICSKLRKLLH